MQTRKMTLAVTCLVALAGAAQTSGITVDTGDGLVVTFSDIDGAVTDVTVDGASIPLLPGETGGLSLQLGSQIPPYGALWLDFDANGGPWTAAHNADWEDAGPYVTWIPDAGVGDSGHLLLGDGVTTGVGMAMESPVPVPAGSTLRISWQARSASIETTQILCVRLFDAGGTDITAASPAPPGWGWTSTSQAHGVWGLHCSAPDTWEPFEEDYVLPPDAASIRVSLRHWTGGDHLVHIDDLRVDVIGGIDWSEWIPVLGSVSLVAGGFMQSLDVPGADLHVETTVTNSNGHIDVGVVLQDESTPPADRPVLMRWTLPVVTEGGRWWDDVDTWRQIAPDSVESNTFDLAGHTVSLYPFSSVTGAGFGLSLGVPMDEPVVQRFECDAAAGLRSVWEIALSPLTAKLGAGRAATSLVLFRHDAGWGFRAAAERYHALFPHYFVKRTTREGAWMYPIHPSQIPDPDDFGFAFHETWPLDETERAVCAQYDIGIFYYTEPWLAWQPWGNTPDKPPYEERVALLESWAASTGSYVAWLPDGGVGDSGHLLLGDGSSLGAGMATSNAFPVYGGDTAEISWQAQVASTQTTQILCVRLFDSAQNDITETTPAPAGWFWSSVSQAHVVAGIANTTPDAWEPFVYTYSLPAQATGMRVSLRYWNGGDRFVHIDDLQVESTGSPITYLVMEFETASGPWVSAQNADWENAVPIWLRAPRQQTAQAVINSSPLDADGRYLIDSSAYLWHEWALDSWNQAWPVNSDPDLPDPSAFDLYREYWVLHRIDETDGVYIDSVTTYDGVGGWTNYRADHLAVSDSPLTFSWSDGGPTQLAPQAQAEFLGPIAAEIRNRGQVMMLNLFPQATRFHAHNADVMGSEVFQLVESNALSRLRRTLASRRIVSNLLQWGWDSPTYITYAEMEQFIRGQLFWGFYPAVSSAGGMLTGGTPDRYFLHPELYERDRPLFQLYMPVLRLLSSAGWEPITHAAATPAGEIERFGDFSRGPMFLTVRGADGAALDAEITVDVTSCGMADESLRVDGTDELADQPMPVERLTAPARVRFTVSLAGGEVGVYSLALYPPADFDQDGDVDLGDFAVFAACIAGPGETAPPVECTQQQFDMADLEGDDDVDLRDFTVFQQAFGG
ncbi:MAG: hypothetical protein JSV19_04175 [Phycisphaerales bacterium]|nr:MAG: hypothetical protein JSV19_04175 [Phycisphaerales bacterium]